MTTYCAPCLADLALVREATTAVGGTTSCMAHAVLLTHPGDDPHRRRQRLAQLRDSAAEKLETAGPEERLRLEILVEEYGLASAMESLVPRRRDDASAPTSRSARKRRGREGRPDGRPGQPGQPGQQGQQGQQGQPGQQRHGGPTQDREAGAGAVADGTAEQQGAEALAQVGAPSGEPPAGSDGPAPAAAQPFADQPSDTSQDDSRPPADATPDSGGGTPASPAPDASPAYVPSALAAETGSSAGDGGGDVGTASSAQPAEPSSASPAEQSSPPSDAGAPASSNAGPPAAEPSLVGQAAPVRPDAPTDRSDDTPSGT